MRAKRIAVQVKKGAGKNITRVHDAATPRKKKVLGSLKGTLKGAKGSKYEKARRKVFGMNPQGRQAEMY